MWLAGIGAIVLAKLCEEGRHYHRLRQILGLGDRGGKGA